MKKSKKLVLLECRSVKRSSGLRTTNQQGDRRLASDHLGDRRLGDIDECTWDL